VKVKRSAAEEEADGATTLSFGAVSAVGRSSGRSIGPGAAEATTPVGAVTSVHVERSGLLWPEGLESAEGPLANAACPVAVTPSVRPAQQASTAVLNQNANQPTSSEAANRPLRAVWRPAGREFTAAIRVLMSSNNIRPELGGFLRGKLNLNRPAHHIRGCGEEVDPDQAGPGMLRSQRRSSSRVTSSCALRISGGQDDLM
jgi:hypothetical protein